jgi:RNA polymerase sigma-70 factor (ECF subfamily)
MNQFYIDSLIDCNQKEISKLYYNYRNSFINFGRKYGTSSESLADIYQEAFLVLRKHAIEGRLNKLDCTLKTYLFGIGKRMIFNHFKQNKSTIAMLNNTSSIKDEVEEITFDIAEELTIEQKLLRTFFNLLGKRCQEMLTLFYYRGLTVKEIAQKAGYQNVNVVSSQKSRCIKQLKQLINNSRE